MTQELNELIKSAYELGQQKDALEAQAEEIKNNLTAVGEQIEKVKGQILTILKDSNENEVSIDDLFANVFRKENIGYTSDADVIKYLKENGYSKFVKVKTTESLDKNPLKKELKLNESLAKALEGYTVKTLTEYVVVTNAENHQKMLEHINEGK